MTQRLITGPGVLAKLAQQLPSTKPVIAAVAYATADDHLALGDGDSIIVNAHEHNVRTGGTDPSLIGRWLKAGVSVSSHEELHAKVVTRGKWAAVGSANLSDRANRVEEALWVGNDPVLLHQAHTFLDRLTGDAVALDMAWVKAMTPLFGTARTKPHGSAGSRRPRSIMPKTLRRVVLANGVEDNTPTPKYVETAMVGAGTGHRFQAWACQVGTDSIVRAGDLLIWINTSTGTMASPVLVTSRPTRAGGPSRWAVTTWDTGLAEPLSLPSLPATVRTRLGSANEVAITAPALQRRLLGAWGLTP